MISFNKTVIIWFILSVLFVGRAQAALDTGVSVGLKSEWNDNINKTSFDRENGFINTVLLKANLSGEDSGYEYGVKYDIDYRRYSGGQYDANTYMTGNMFLNLELLPGRFKWKNKLRSAVTERDSRSPSVPTNQDQRNTFTTSPIITLVNTKRDKLLLNSSLEKTTYREQTQNDSTRIKADLAYSHAFSRLSAGGITCGYAAADFEIDTGYDSFTCKLTGQRRLKQGSLNFELGQSRVEPDLGDDFDGFVYSLTVNLKPGLDRFYLFSSREVTDTVDVFYGTDFTNNPISPPDTNTDLLSLSIRKRTEIGVERAFTTKTRASFFLFVAKDDLYQSDEDTDREGAGINFTRDLSDTMDINLYGIYQRVEFGGGSVPVFIDYTTEYYLSLNKNLSEAFRVVGWLRAEDRRTKDEDLTYEAYGIGVSAQYSF